VRGHVVDYQRRDGGSGRSWRQPAHLGFWLYKVPRPMLACRLFGHKPVTDGHDTRYGKSARWVCCARCGERGRPQGNLDPAVYPLGARYRGPWGEAWPDEDSPAYWEKIRKLKAEGVKADQVRGFDLPGPIPRGGSGTLGGELVIGRSAGGRLGFEVKVGNPGSEHVLAAQLGLGWLGALYLHTSDGYGRWVQRRLNPDGYDSRLISVEFGLDEVRWRWWSRRDNHDGVRESWWRNGGIHLRPLDRLLGRKRYRYTAVPGCTTSRIVRLPEGDYLVELTLQRQTHGRARGPKRRTWSVDWQTPRGGKGLPFKRHDDWKGNCVYGSGVAVSDASVQAGTWAAEAAAAIAANVTRMRTREGWDPIGRHIITEKEFA
jgi:hypothetical protein